MGSAFFRFFKDFFQIKRDRINATQPLSEILQGEFLLFDIVYQPFTQLVSLIQYNIVVNDLKFLSEKSNH